MNNYSIRWFGSWFRGAPELNGTAGAAVAILDALLDTGFGVVSVTSIVVSDGVATATVGAGESFEPWSYVAISGATPSELNGVVQVIASSSTTFEFLTDAADGTASGTISARYAPHDAWEVQFTDTNKRVYKSTDAASFGCSYRVDDSGTTDFRLAGYESMSDIDTGANEFPLEAQISGGGYIEKSSTANGTRREYIVACDSRAVYLFFSPYASGGTWYGVPFRGFGDLAPVDVADVWMSFVSCTDRASDTNGGGTLDSSTNADARGVYIARDAVGTSHSIKHLSRAGISKNVSGSVTTVGNYANSIIAENLLIHTGAAASFALRGTVPGAKYIMNNVLSSGVSIGDVINDTNDGRKYLFVPTNGGSFIHWSGPTGRLLLDIDGPWR